MTVPPPESFICQCMTTKILRPDRCIMLDGNSCSACTQDIALEQEREKIEKLREKIYIKRRALRTAMNQNHDRLIHRFPPEIASRVFSHCSLTNLRFNTYENTNTLFLGAVCQRWRRLAWATPELWTSIYIGKKIIDQWTINAEQPLAEWLERSGSLELTIRFLDPSSSESVDGVYHGDGSAEQALGALVRYSFRHPNASSPPSLRFLTEKHSPPTRYLPHRQPK